MTKAFPCLVTVLTCLFQGLPAAVADRETTAYESGTPADESALTLLRITPDGEDAPAGRQIVFQFDRPVVPVGRMERDAEEVPIEISPAVACQWRWIDTSALACRLDEDDALRPATLYKVRVEAGFRTEEGVTMAEPVAHRFTTERPKVTQSSFGEWRAPGWPRVRLTFNQAVTAASVEAHVAFQPVGDDRSHFGLQVAPAESDRAPVLFAPLPGEPYGLVGPEHKSDTVDDRPVEHRGEPARRVWMVEPEKELPLDAEIHLSVEPGLVSAHGPERGAESRTVVSFRTYPEFRFLGVRCAPEADREPVLLAPRYPSRETLPETVQRCLPLQPISLVFSAPVINEEVEAHVRFSPDLAGGRSDFDPWANTYGHSALRYPHYEDRTYEVRLPVILKAFQRYEITGDDPGVSDEFGRRLPEPIDMAFMTAHRRPRLVLGHDKAVLEKQVDTDVPVYVTNLDTLYAPHRAITAAGETHRADYRSDVAPVQDLSFAVPLGVREMLGGRSGAVTGYLDSKPRVPHYDYDRYRFFAQVTPFQVHVKLGHFSSLAWITDLATGEPVAGAKLAVYVDDYSLSKAAPPNVHDAAAGIKGALEKLWRGLPFTANEYPEPEGTLATAVSDGSGVARLPGTETLSPDMDLLWNNWRDTHPRLFIRIDKDEDFALVPLDHYFRTWAGEMHSYTRRKDGHLHAWGTTAQGIYKVGDTIEYKLYVRNQSNRRWVPPPEGDYSLKVIDPKNEVVAHIEALKLSGFGAYHGELELGERAAVGWYRFQLRYEGVDDQDIRALRVLVSDFTPAPFRVTTDLNGRRFEPGDRLEVTTLAQLHAGGPYTDAETRTTVHLRPRPLRPDHPVSARFNFDLEDSNQRRTMLHQSTETGGARGEVSTGFVLDDQDVHYGRLSVEGAVRDERGKFVAARAGAEYFGRDRYVGLRNTRWLYEEDEPAEVEYLVVDRSGAPVADASVAIEIERENVKASRVKGAGNAYLTQYIHEWVEAGQCEGVSGVAPQACTFVPEEPGNYRLTAAVEDTRGRVHRSRVRAWVTGQGRVTWQEPEDYSLQIVPEQEIYKVGDTARFLVKNPIPGSEAMITVERYGVLDHWIRRLDDSTAVVEVPIKPDYLPGFYLSVLVNSPRVDKPLGEGNVDLGKPTFRLGYVKVPVTDAYKEIDVRVETGREVYKPRDTVTARITAKPRHGDGGQPLEIAAVVIDEAVFDLNTEGRDYYDPYQGFNHLEALDLNNYSLLTRLVGRQKFEDKGANPGGGGAEGSAELRSLFKFVSYWNPSITPDENGRAEIDFELPDNLTGWRIFAWAVTPGDRMGLGDAAIKVNQPTELRPVMPNQVTEGDRFVAGFSVMNRTEQTRTVTVEINARGAIAPGSDDRLVTELTLEPYKRRTAWLAVQTKGAGEVAFLATAKDAQDGDAVEHHVAVNRRRSLVTAADYGTTTAPQVSTRVVFPREIHADTGGISVTTAPSVIGNIAGAFDYIRDYPYRCWEQQLTRAVMASHYNNLRGYLPAELDWQDSEALPQTLLDRAASFQAPNGGMTYWIPRDQYVSPYLSAYTALAFNWLRQSGYEVPGSVERKLHDYLDAMLRRDVMPGFYSAGMASSVRAVALAALAAGGAIDRDDVLRYESHLAQMDLFGKAHYLKAAALAGARDSAGKASRLILNQAVQSGGKFQFNEPWDDSYSYILATPLRSNCAVLDALMSFTTDEESLNLVGDVPFKQVRAITQSRGNRDHWENTQENVFCMNALTAYARVYEKEEPDMTVAARVDDRPIGEARYTGLRDKAVTFEDPVTEASPGLEAEVTLTKEGPGRVYYATRMQYAPTTESAQRINAGMDIRREYSVERNGEWQLLDDPMRVERGELVRIDIYLSLPTLRHFVVVDDPVPGGLEPVNRDLATASTVDAGKGEFKAADGAFWFNYEDWSYYGRYGYSFYHKELRHHAARFFADYLPAGNYHLSYTAQAIAAGEFSVVPVHAEEMYDPDVFGKGLPAVLVVGEQ